MLLEVPFYDTFDIGTFRLRDTFLYVRVEVVLNTYHNIYNNWVRIEARVYEVFVLY